MTKSPSIHSFTFKSLKLLPDILWLLSDFSISVDHSPAFPPRSYILFAQNPISWLTVLSNNLAPVVNSIRPPEAPVLCNHKTRCIICKITIHIVVRYSLIITIY